MRDPTRGLCTRDVRTLTCTLSSARSTRLQLHQQSQHPQKHKRETARKGEEGSDSRYTSPHSASVSAVHTPWPREVQADRHLVSVSVRVLHTRTSVVTCLHCTHTSKAKRTYREHTRVRLAKCDFEWRTVNHIRNRQYASAEENTREIWRCAR